MNKISNAVYGIVSKEISDEIFLNLSEIGIRPVKLSGFLNCDNSIKNHPDIYITRVNRNLNFLSRNACSIEGKVFKKIRNIDLEVFDSDIECRYPYDCSMNCVFLGKFLVGNTKVIHKRIIEFASDNDIEIIHVNQGYTKCNMCIVDDFSVITEDVGISKKLRKHGFDVLLLENNDVMLRNYRYGFIGGASGKISDDKIAFFGDITKHREYDSIKNFLFKRDVEPISLSKEPLYDYGSLLLM